MLAKPLNTTLSGVKSSTAKRILDTLDRMSTPIGVSLYADPIFLMVVNLLLLCSTELPVETLTFSTELPVETLPILLMNYLSKHHPFFYGITCQ